MLSYKENEIMHIYIKKKSKVQPEQDSAVRGIRLQEKSGEKEVPAQKGDLIASEGSSQSWPALSLLENSGAVPQGVGVDVL